MTTEYITRDELKSAISECAQNLAVIFPALIRALIRGLNGNLQQATSAHIARSAISAQDHDADYAELFATEFMIAMERCWESHWASREFLNGNISMKK